MMRKYLENKYTILVVNSISIVEGLVGFHVLACLFVGVPLGSLLGHITF